jgi:hypothetical protein
MVISKSGELILARYRILMGVSLQKLQAAIAGIITRSGSSHNLGRKGNTARIPSQNVLDQLTANEGLSQDIEPDGE